MIASTQAPKGREDLNFLGLNSFLMLMDDPNVQDPTSGVLIHPQLGNH